MHSERRVTRGKGKGAFSAARSRRETEFLIDNSRRDGARVMYQLIRGFIARRRERASVFMPRAGRFMPRYRRRHDRGGSSRA